MKFRPNSRLGRSLQTIIDSLSTIKPSTQQSGQSLYLDVATLNYCYGRPADLFIKVLISKARSIGFDGLAERYFEPLLYTPNVAEFLIAGGETILP